MKKWASSSGPLPVLLLLCGVLLCGCGGGVIPGNNPRGVRGNRRGNFTSAVVWSERCQQLAIHSDIYCLGCAAPDDWRQHQSVRQFGKRRGAHQRFELL